MSPQINRRSLIKGMVVSSLSLGAGALVAKENDEKRNWDEEFDIVIVGFGAAGAAAALTANELKQKVVILEKMAHGGGNTACSGGGFIIPEDSEKAFEYLKGTYAFADNSWDPAVLKAFCDGAVTLRAFFEKFMPEARLGTYGHGTFKNFPYSETITKYSVRGRKAGGANLFNALQKAVEAKQIPIKFNTSGRKIISKNGEVLGILAVQDNKEILIKARKAVILTTGGFEADKKSLQTFMLGTEIGTIGSPGNTGDGLRMAMSMGAQLWHMTSAACPMGIQIPGHKTLMGLGVKGKSFIWVNKFGERFVNEAGVDVHNCLYNVNHLNTLKRTYPAIPAYMIFDQAFMESGPLTNFSFGYICDHEGFKWSKDNKKELEMGVILKGDTLQELASKINVPADALSKTVKKWNDDLAIGDDTLFGRKQKGASTGNANAQFAPSLSAPLAENGPYFAVKILPGFFHTNGGPKRNQYSQVLDQEDKPISRLYAAGELGSIWGTFQQGSTNLAECLVFGQIAATEASKEKALN